MTMTNKLQKAIEIATENGYLHKGDKLMYDTLIGQLCVPNGDGAYLIVHIEAIALDPQFWEALGKGLGWKLAGWEAEYEVFWERKPHLCYMHLMIDHLQKGGTVEEYISNLIE